MSNPSSLCLLPMISHVKVLCTFLQSYLPGRNAVTQLHPCMWHCVLVWDLDKKTCYRTFKHRSKVVAVALSDSQCISGCEQGRIKVWQLESGHLIKVSQNNSVSSLIHTCSRLILIFDYTDAAGSQRANHSHSI